MMCRRQLALGCALFLVSGCAAIRGGDSASAMAAKFEKAAAILKEVTTIPESGIPADLLIRAEAVAVFPGVVKGAFAVGGRFGDGVVSVRRPDGSWSPPALVFIGGASYGLQVGAEFTDLVLLVMSRRGTDSLLRSKVTLGADASVAAGPIGRRGGAATDILLTADILSYSRTKGLFAGISIEGATVQPDDEGNAALYGLGYSAREILRGDRVTAPGVTEPFLTALRTYAARTR